MNLGSFMAATRRLESGSFGGNYSALGRWVKGDRAQGAYQIMSKNWPSWSAQAGIAGADWRDPAAQDRVAAHKMQEYYRRFGDWWRVALAWFAGGSVAQITIDRGYRSPSDIRDPGLREYVNKVMNWQREAAAAGWDEVVRGITDTTVHPAPPSYVPDEMAQVQNPEWYQQQEYIRNSGYEQYIAWLQAVANQIAQGNRQNLDELEEMKEELEGEEPARASLDPEASGMSRDVTSITLNME